MNITPIDRDMTPAECKAEREEINAMFDKIEEMHKEKPWPNIDKWRGFRAAMLRAVDLLEADSHRFCQ